MVGGFPKRVSKKGGSERTYKIGHSGAYGKVAKASKKEYLYGRLFPVTSPHIEHNLHPEHKTRWL